MSPPYEVVAGPLTAYVAPVATAFPAVNAAPGGSWFKLGTNGTKNYDEKGVSVQHSQQTNKWRSAGGTGVRKVFRTAEDLMVDFELVDLTVEQYAKILNDATVTTAAGPPAIKSFNLQQGLNVQTFALLLRGTSSAYGDALPAQYQLPIVWQEGNPQPTFQKGGPAGLALQYGVIEDLTLGYGIYVAQTA